jgi:predicted RNA-binding protein with RPS1 domain
MNAKLAKQLRKTAKILSVEEDGTPFVSYAQVEDTSKRKKRFEMFKNEEGKDDFRKIELSLGMMSNADRSVRGVYRHLKKQLKA